MDPASILGIVTGVVGLVPLCAGGFDFIAGICKAHEGAQEHMIRIQMQRGILRAWSKVWELPLRKSDQGKSAKFQKWIENNPELGTDVFDILCAISDVLADTTKLEKEYGIALRKRHSALREVDVRDLLHGRKNALPTQKDIDARKTHMSIVRSCKFQLKGSAKLEGLVERLIEYVENIRKICSELQAERIGFSLVQQVAEIKDPIMLERISKVYDDEATKRRSRGQRHEGYDLVQEVATFKARVQVLSSKRVRKTSERRQSGITVPFLFANRFWMPEELNYKNRRWEFADGRATLGVEQDSHLVRYIEWKSYTDKDGRGDSDIENDIMKLADLFGAEERPKALRVLTFLGILRDKEELRFGFIFKPPHYIENIEPADELERGISKPRLPQTLLECITKGATSKASGIFPLGDRFNIARKLAKSIYVMHAAGWVHKNIRSSSVMFLPEESTYGGIPSTSGAIDIENPYLCGFLHSRPGPPMPEKTESRPSRPVAEETGPYEPKTTMEWSISLDPYHHPAKRLDQSIRYLQAFDMYSLGIVLLEIGFWQSLQSFGENMASDWDDNGSSGCERQRSNLIQLVKNELPGQVGKIYAQAVEACLSASRNDSDAVTREKLCWNVCAVLDQCVA